ncbi:MAG: 50S ribosome-binding GTPase [Planctomycetales bacterium]|nr:50S ribosome-binding GTPase [Planctomycetales bacterium]
MLDISDTIVAIASAPGIGARGIVRLSGPDVAHVALPYFYADQPADTQRRSRVPQMQRGSWRLADELPPLPCTICYWPTERSYTRQPTLELHTVACRPLLDRIVIQLTQAGARLAEPGEFTLRSFLAGRLDLTQAEAVLGVIDANDQRDLHAALEQLAGGISQPLHLLMSQLIDVCADIEAGLDFVDEDITFIGTDQVQATLSNARQTLAESLRQLEERGDCDSEQQIVLWGQPNTGKSTLWNRLIGSETAIVSDIAGTTRDYLVASIRISDQQCLLLDTAGLDAELSNPIDAKAQNLAARARDHADVGLLCLDATRAISAWEREQLQTGQAMLVLANKADAEVDDFRESLDATVGATNLHIIRVSARTGVGIGDLQQQLAICLDRQPNRDGRGVASTALRCRESLREATEAVIAAHELSTHDAGHELIAAEIRNAINGLGQVLGTVYTDDILDRVFQRFCIGK